MSMAATREPVFLKDYRPPTFLTPTIELDFVLDPEATLVTSRQTFRRNAPGDELVLHGEDQELVGLALDGAPLPEGSWRLESDRLVLRDLRGPGRIREIALDRLDVTGPSEHDGKRLYRLTRRA